MEKKQTAVNAAITYLCDQRRAAMIASKLPDRCEKYYNGKIKTLDSIIESLGTLLPVERKQIEEAYDAGQVNYMEANTGEKKYSLDKGTSASDYFTTTYKGE